MRDNYRTHLAHKTLTSGTSAGAKHSRTRDMLRAARERLTARAGCDAWGRNSAGCIVGADTASALTGPVTASEAGLGAGAAIGLLGLVLGAPLWAGLLLGAGAAYGTKVAIDKAVA
jgi:hypothetical protein